MIIQHLGGYIDRTVHSIDVQKLQNIYLVTCVNQLLHLMQTTMHYAPRSGQAIHTKHCIMKPHASCSGQVLHTEQSKFRI